MPPLYKGGIPPELLESLFAAECICEYSAPEHHSFLSTAENRERVNQYMLGMNRKLLTTSDRSVYFGGWVDLDSRNARTDVRQVFSQAINDMEPLIRWLKMMKSIGTSGAPISPGETLRVSDLLREIESAPALVEQLDKIAKSRLFKSSSPDPKRQLVAILDRLVAEQYLLRKGASGSMYVATGKWTRLYDVIAFVASHEGLDEEGDAADQVGMEF